MRRDGFEDPMGGAWAGSPWRHRRGGMRFGMGGPWGPMGPRARRGDVRAAILSLLAEGPMHGYQIIQELSSRTGGAWQPSPGSVYPTLPMLEDEGLVEGRELEGKREFSLTDTGRSAVAERGAGAPPWEEVAGGPEDVPMRLRQGLFQLGAAAMQVAHAGSPSQVKETLAILGEARKKLYAMLAEGTP
jgi:DNA-binding PadR family transcriptional regulator